MTASNKDELVLTRVLDAPIDQVWRAWTEREHLMQWWGQPTDATMPYCTMDLRVGGSFTYHVHLPDGMIIRGKSIYKEIQEPERLVFDDVFTDEAGNVIVNDEFPQMQVAATFEDLGNGKTKLTVVHTGIAKGAATIDQYRQGWSECLDRLEADLASF